MSFHRLVRGAAAPALGLVCAVPAFGGTLTANATVGSRSATVVFEAQGSNLVVKLTNASAADVTLPIDVLTAVFFTISDPTVTLTRVSGLIVAGSSVINTGSQPAGGVVGGEWAYKAAIVGAPHGASSGISSSGLGLFSPGDLFPGSNLDGPVEPDGLQFGITSAGDDPSTNNGGTSNPLIKNEVVFTLSGLPSGFDPEARIGNLSFQYGTALTEPNIQVPAPGALALLGLAAGLGSRRKR